MRWARLAWRKHHVSAEGARSQTAAAAALAGAAAARAYALRLGGRADAHASTPGSRPSARNAAALRVL